MMQEKPVVSVRIWDLPTRVFHWALVAGMGFMWFSAEVSDSLLDWHMRVGEFLLALVLFRLLWGVVGSDTARFSQFIRSPGQALSYLKILPSRQPSWHPGHNPLGGWMVVAVLLLVLVQAVSGLFISDDILSEGPLYPLVSEAWADRMASVHHQAFDLLLVLIGVHIAAILYYLGFKRTNLLRAMLTGHAHWPQHTPMQARLTFRHGGLGLLLFAGCYVVVYFGVQWLASSV